MTEECIPYLLWWWYLCDLQLLWGMDMTAGCRGREGCHMMCHW